MLSPLRIKDRLFYGWIVVAAFCILGITIYGTRLSFGVFFKSIESEFSLTRTTTSGIFSVHMVLACVFSILGGWALDRYGPRIVILLMGIFTGLSLLLTSQTNAPWQIFITYSLLLSIGGGAIYIVIMATVSRWFDKKRGLAMGIGGSGSGLGILIMTPFATYLISSFGWRMAYIIMGLIASVIVIPLSRLFRKDPYEIGVLPDGKRAIETGIEEPGKENSAQPAGFSLRQAAKTRNFWFFESIWLLYAVCFLLVLTHIVPHATDIGIPAMEAAAVLGLIGGANIAGRVLMGWVSDRIGRRKAIISCALLAAGAMIWLIWSRDLWMLYLFALVYGFAHGGISPPITALVGETFGLRNIGLILGVIEIGWGVGGAIGPAIGGLIFDTSNTYSLAFIIGALAMLTVALLTALVRREASANI